MVIRLARERTCERREHTGASHTILRVIVVLVRMCRARSEILRMIETRLTTGAQLLARLVASKRRLNTRRCFVQVRITHIAVVVVVVVKGVRTLFVFEIQVTRYLRVPFEVVVKVC